MDLQQLGVAPAQQLRVAGRGQPERRLARRGQPERRPARLARLAGPQRRRRLQVRVPHREVLLDHAVHRHRGLREVGQVARRHVPVDNKRYCQTYDRFFLFTGRKEYKIRVFRVVSDLLVVTAAHVYGFLRFVSHKTIYYFKKVFNHHQTIKIP